MATARPFNGFLSLFLFLLHLGCFFFTPNPRPNQHPPPHKRRKLVPLSSSPPSSSSAPSSDPHKSLSLSIRSYLNHLFTFNNKPTKHQPPLAPATPTYSHQPPLPLSPDDTADESPPESGEKPEISADTTIKHGSFSSRTEIFPCHACGEVLSKPQLLDLHQATKHALSELRDGESGKNIVGIIFQSGWRGKAPAVHRILKIHNTPRTLARFEEYREAVRSRAARHAGRRVGGGVDERCIADGNERLRFYCSTILCSQERRGGRNRCPTGVCGSQFCSTCAIVRHGFSGKQVDLDGIATHANSWDAHVSLPHDLEEEFAFLHVQRAMLVCRVIAGRVARCGAAEEEAEKGVFDSVVPLRLRGGPRSSWAEEEEELLVFSPRAVLPCFIIIYTP